MQKELDDILRSSEKNMKKALDHLKIAFSKIQAGKPSIAIFEFIMIEYYGSFTPLNQIANIIILDAMTISIQPFDSSLINIIKKSIINLNLGLNPNNNGENIIIKIPPLTEDRRKELNKKIKVEAENIKISIRNFRQHANNELKKNKESSKDLIKEYIDRIQKNTNFYIKKVEKYLLKKESEIIKI